MITPSFNQSRFLEEALRSVILQDHPNIEYLVVDGGSTDGSLDLIERYEPWISSWTSEPDDGQADAINKGFDLATGEFICWLNSDDVMGQGFLSRRVGELSARPEVDLVYGDVVAGWTDGVREPFRGEALPYLEMLRTLRVSIPQQSAMWRRSTIDRIGRLDPRWRVVLDREYFLRIARRGVVEYRPGACGWFRHHAQAKSIADALEWIDELPRLYTELFASVDLSPEEASVERETMAGVHLLCADIARGARDWRAAAVHLARAFESSPVHAIGGFTAARVRGLWRRICGPASGRGQRSESTS